MTWEILSGFAVLLGAVISIMNIVVKVNKSLISLEETVRSLKVYMEKQDIKNGHFYDELNILDKRVTLLEERALCSNVIPLRTKKDGVKD